MELNFEVDNKALAIVKNTVINANFDEVKSVLTEMTEPYKNLVVTADMIPVAKSDRAKIRRVASTIDEYRKTVKRVYTQQFSAFETKCKELTAICAEASGNLDTQIKEYEEAAKKKKIDELEFFFQELPKEHGDFISFRDIYDERWKNATFAIEDAKDIIRARVAENDVAVDTILELKSPFEVALLYQYRLCHDMTAVLQHKRRLEEEADKGFAEAKEDAEKPSKEVDFKVTPSKLLIDLTQVDRTQIIKLKGYLVRNGFPFRTIV